MTDYGMFSDEGNKYLDLEAKRLIEEYILIDIQEDLTEERVEDGCMDALRAAAEKWDEALDTMVRDIFIQTVLSEVFDAS